MSRKECSSSYDIIIFLDFINDTLAGFSSLSAARRQ
jgi:hypothetical protein